MIVFVLCAVFLALGLWLGMLYKECEKERNEWRVTGINLRKLK